ncbi:hypothetical protein Pla22_12880 [Rubripirellula amarantea]|uniref:VWFA domain-containing protein n=1 Tax=Rubripirellula amarantea TaxID=2527999 RepID=A0A5C5WT16_9BACT|nr:hypothetical protein [Rubripirellula amarantea]TWT53658.1 hypothetical protein Pla22_12880 [Rubripirellula amarantea]
MSDSATPGNSSSDSANSEDLRRMLELELQKTRNEASAARLEARAAEIEILMRNLRHQSPDATVQRADPSEPASPVRHLRKSTQSFASWDDVRSAQSGSVSRDVPTNGVQHHSPTTSSTDFHSSPTKHSLPGQDSLTFRVDDQHPSVPAPRSSRSPTDTKSPGSQSSVADPDRDDTVEPSVAPAVAAAGLLDLGEATKPTFDVSDAELADQISPDWVDDEQEPSSKKRRPIALLVSAATHVLVLLLLAAIGLQNHRPKDQVSLSASTSETSEVAMESFSIETTELETEPEEVVEPTISETEYELSPVGTMKVAQISPDSIAAPAASIASSMASGASSSSSSMSLKSNSNSKMEFCGVEGGGNHFVYLVDSSGSMGDGFESARQALLSSIDVLTPTQRFYVVFFDAESDFMRISNPGVDEPNSVYATPENKAALRRWAMRIKMDRGKAPYDPLKFALGLKPDVIFLLSDGEFPEGILNLLKEENQVENLFGESKPVSIVHTIGYFSKEGASIMSRIAKQNSGQYRHIPKP